MIGIMIQTVNTMYKVWVLTSEADHSLDKVIKKSKSRSTVKFDQNIT